MDRPGNNFELTPNSQFSGFDLLQQHRQADPGKGADNPILPRISLNNPAEGKDTPAAAANDAPLSPAPAPEQLQSDTSPTASNQSDYAKTHKASSDAMLDNYGKPPEQSAVFANSRDIRHNDPGMPNDRSAQPGTAQAQPNEFDGMAPTSVGRSSNDCDLTSYKVWQKDKDIRIETATKNIENIKLAGTAPSESLIQPPVPVESCSISHNGKEVASIKNDKGKLKYVFTDLAQNQETIDLRSADYDLHHNIILKTDDNKRIELKADGSQVTYDDKSGHAVRTIDSNGNEFKYNWDKDEVTSATVQGPMTSRQLLEFNKAGMVDNVMDNLPKIVGTALVSGGLALSVPFVGTALAGGVSDKFMGGTAGKYKVFVEGREQPATLSLGAGAGSAVGSAGVSASMGMPVQRTVNIGVLDNGGFTITQPSETVNGVINNYSSSIALLPDGTSTLLTSNSKEPVRRATNGMAIETKK